MESWLKIGNWRVEGLEYKQGNMGFIDLVKDHNEFGMTESWAGERDVFLYTWVSGVEVETN